MTTESRMVVSSGGAVTEAADTGAGLPVMSEARIQAMKHNVALFERLVTELLEEGIDYGLAPGVARPFLWDPGAWKVMAAFNVYAKHEILRETTTDELISWVVEAQLIERNSGRVVATGVGAASTEETARKYRWVNNPEDYGYSIADFKGRQIRKPRDSGGKTLYRILNPDFAEELNNIVKMAAKRAECDAAQTLPGVGSGLRKLFYGGMREEAPRRHPQRQSSPQGAGQAAPGPARREAEEEDTWNHFWGEVKRLGYTPDATHRCLGVVSMKEWLGQGHTREEALEKLRKTAPAPATGPAPAPEAPVGLKGTTKQLDAFWRDADRLGIAKADVLHILGIERGSLTYDGALQAYWLGKGKTFSEALAALEGTVHRGPDDEAVQAAAQEMSAIEESLF